MTRVILTTIALGMMSNLPAQAGPRAVLQTSNGTIELELDQARAPISVGNFKQYCQTGFFAGTIFHRVIRNFMIQGGGLTADMRKKPTRAPIKNEAANGLKNRRGTIAMARTNIVDSATAQFFINVVDNVFLDHKSTTPQGFGYAVFGKVARGMEVVDAIRSVTTTSRGGQANVPTKAITITSCKWIGP